MNDINLNFLRKYFKQLNKLILPNEKLLKELIKIKDLILKCKRNKNKILIFGNGGSYSIASHFALDLTNSAKVNCLTNSDPSQITCYSNDFKFENYIKKTIEYYHKNGDGLILISSSGNSKNMINAAKYAKNKSSFIVTLTGFGKKNKLCKMGDVNLNVENNTYNIIENIHQIWLLGIVDLIKKNKK